MSDKQEDWIRWQMSQTGDPADIHLWPPKDMKEEDIRRICAMYVMITVAVWASLVGIALIAGVIMWVCGVL
jgi:hypothetical protein